MFGPGSFFGRGESDGLDPGEPCWLVGEPFGAVGQDVESTPRGSGVVAKEGMVNVPSAPCTDSITRFSLVSERLTLLILREGHLEIPCCLHIRFIVVGQTAKPIAIIMI